jgi:chromate reductase
MTKVGVFVGSLRKEAFSGKVAHAVAAMMPNDFEMRFMNIGNLAMFNQDFDDENKTPSEWTQFRQDVKALDGLLFVTPEYNRSYTAVLKNALDIGSRPAGQNVWAGKPGAVIGISPGKLSAMASVMHLRQPLAFLDVRLMMQPEIFLGDAANLFGEDGQLTNESTKGFLQKFALQFADWVKMKK